MGGMPFMGGMPGMGGMGGMPGMPDNIGEILNDKEFQNFFEEFAGSMMGGASGEGAPESDMMKNLMEEFTGFMKKNEDNSEMKTEFE